jgi:hypothetical protein
MPPLFTEMPLPSKESEWPYIYIYYGFDFASFYDFSAVF